MYHLSYVYVKIKQRTNQHAGNLVEAAGLSTYQPVFHPHHLE